MVKLEPSCAICHTLLMGTYSGAAAVKQFSNGSHAKERFSTGLHCSTTMCLPLRTKIIGPTLGIEANAWNPSVPGG